MKDLEKNLISHLNLKNSIKPIKEQVHQTKLCFTAYIWR